MKVRLHQGFQVHLDHHLGHTVGYRGDPQRPFPAITFRYLYRPHRRREITPGLHPIPKFVEVTNQVPLELRNRFPIHTSSTLVCLYPLIGLPHHSLGNTKRPCLIQWLLPFLVDHPIKPIDTTPSLHPHYGTSSLLRVVPPLCPASVLSPSWVLHLGFSLSIGTTASHVPPESLVPVHATFMPDATQAVHSPAFKDLHFELDNPVPAFTVGY